MTIPFIILFAMVCISIVIKFIISKSTKTPEPEKQKPQAPSRPPLTDAEREAIRQAEEVWDWDTRRAIIDGTYSGPLPEHRFGDTQTYTHRISANYSPAYVSSRPAETFTPPPAQDPLVAEPTNKHDPNAIKIISFDGRHLGFIPADETTAVREFLSGTLPPPCRVHVDEDEQDVYSENADRFYTRHYLIGRVNIYRNKGTE